MRSPQRTTWSTAGSKRSALTGHEFSLGRCPACRCGRVLEPRTDYAALYDEDYYRGKGADPKVDYLAELNDPKTARRSEWRSLAQLVDGLIPLSTETIA